MDEKFTTFTTFVQDDSASSSAVDDKFAETSITTTTETSISVDYEHIQHNTDGILLMTTGIFFLLVIYFVGKLLGGFLSM